MLTLVIETATPACSVALVQDGAVVAEAHALVGRGHAERLLPMIHDLLAGRRPAAILVDCGPGSFTGVRVGLAAAQGLRIGWGAPLSGYSSMSLLAAAAVREPGGFVGVALHGGHGQIFVQDFGDDPLRPLGPLASLAPDAAAAALEAPLVIGSAAASLVALRGHGEARDAVARAADARLLPLALRTLAPVPIYGRAPDAKLPG
ncbi:MAG TPA: tRNA (adenosine(37)-N6)-threonylcarbamoyltransferase complex dimerization subunit type 1 TsaB [Allosphingosinicella sp.]|jgi:tRNA threonylcarbamoyl adenosine modification protein YeaZ